MHTYLPDHIAESLTPKHLRLIIFPTEKCNLRCTYCYEDFEHGRILPGVVTGLKNLLTARLPELSLLELSWFGGEPLLAVRQILEVCEHAMETIRARSDIRYWSSMTTNGMLLTPELASRLSKVGVRTYQISLDGPSEIHNQTRISINGGGTFDRIWSNLCSLAKTDIDFEITLRVHYQLETWEKLTPLIFEINNNFGKDARFKVFFKSIVRLGGKNDENISKIKKETNEDILSNLYGQLSNRPSQTTEWIKNNYVCYAAKANSLVIRANGLISKCTVALHSEANIVGNLNEDGTVTLDRGKLLPWLKGVETQSAYDLACPYSSHIKALDGTSVVAWKPRSRP